MLLGALDRPRIPLLTQLARLGRLACLTAGALSAMSAPRAEAAWPTRTLSALEKNQPLPDLNFEFTWDRLQRRAKITREWVQDTNGSLEALDVKELRYQEITQRLLIDLRVGVYRDLEFHARAPIILQQDSRIRLAAGVTNSTIFGSLNADDPTYGEPGGNNYRYPITELPASRERAGFGDMTFGLSWSPFVDTKDEAYPTLTLRADVIAPTGKVRDPTDQAALPGNGSGSVGLGMTTFDFSLALSKRMQSSTPFLDPYVLFAVQLPVATPKQKERGLDPAPVGRFMVGTELVLDEAPKNASRYAIDFSFGVKYFGIGRTYSELSDYLPNFNQTLVPGNRPAGSTVSDDVVQYADYDNPANYASRVDGASCGRSTVDGRTSGIGGVPCGELNRVDEHMLVESALSVHVQPARFVLFRAGVSFGLNTDHFLTTERVGRDRDPAGTTASCGGTACAGRVNARNSEGVDERSPYYDPRYDAPGRRFRIEETTNFMFFVTAAALF